MSVSKFASKQLPVLQYGFAARAVPVTSQTSRVFSRFSYSSHDENTGRKENEIRSFLQVKGIWAQSGPTCFRCENIFPKFVKQGRPRKDPTNMSLYINKMTGHFFCVDSWRRGTWESFKEYMNLPHNKRVDAESLNDGAKSTTTSSDLERIKEIWENDSIPLSDLSDLEQDEVREMHQLDAIPLSDLESYGMRTSKTTESIIIPWFMNQISSSKSSTKGLPIGLKRFTLSDDENLSGPKYDITYFPQKNYWGMLGLSQITPSQKRVVLTTNEFDAVAVNSASAYYKAISLPSGTTYLPLEVLPYLEQFSEIILWFNNDLMSWEAARQFSKKLLDKRCRLVRPTANSLTPLRAVSKNLDVDEILSSAVSAEIKNIVSFTDLRGFVKDELMNSDTVCGMQWQRFPHLTKTLKGHRRGELTVVTGPTGSGKTTFMSEYSLDLAMQGVSTLWGSFEIQNVRLIKTMMKQFARSRLENHMKEFDEVANKFQTIPINFMTYNGPQGIKDVIHTMRQAAYVYDIQHIVIDNLQFMMGAMSKNNDRFIVQDQLIAEFRNFASSEHVHVSIVIHPRKEDSGLPLQISSIFGTAKATQEADNVLMLQQVRSLENGSSHTRNYIEIAKNRYDGELGKVPLYFDKSTLCMSKPPTEEKKKPTDADDASSYPHKDADDAKEKIQPGILCAPEDKDPDKPISDDLSVPSWFTDWRNEKRG